MKNVFILGMGEIGTAVAEVEKRAGNTVFYKDLKKGEHLNKTSVYHVAHVCIPFVDVRQFLSALAEGLLGMHVQVVVIHSTVAIGTTRAAARVLRGHIAHSFVRGVHPNLVEGLLTFEKAIGGLESRATEIAMDHFESLGIKTKKLDSPEASEAAKLLSTTYYGWSILFAKAAKELCDEEGLDFDQVYRWANDSYNEGYESLDMKQVTRPVLRPPEGHIGGHCIVPNFKLLPNSKMKDYCIENC